MRIRFGCGLDPRIYGIFAEFKMKLVFSSNCSSAVKVEKKGVRFIPCVMSHRNQVLVFGGFETLGLINDWFRTVRLVNGNIQ